MTMSEKNQAAVTAVFGKPVMLDEEGEDWNALLDYVRHQGQEEAKAASVEGWKLVPVEPTEAMLMAGCEAALSMEALLDNGTFASERREYAAMIAAAPSPPALPVGATIHQPSYEAGYEQGAFDASQDPPQAVTEPKSVDLLRAERDEARGIARVFGDHWPYGNAARDEALRNALCAVPSPNARAALTQGEGQ